MARLIILDMDGTVFHHKNLWLELHKRLGTLDEGEKATREWLYKDYDKLVDIVIHHLWKGKPAQPYLDLVAEAEYLPGAKEAVAALKQKGYAIALISSGSDLLVKRAMDELGIAYGAGNHLDIADDIITGRSQHADGTTMWLVRDDKRLVAERFCAEAGCTLADAVAVGDERNDLALFTAVGTSIAFNDAPDELKEAATHVVEGDDLRMILKYL